MENQMTITRQDKIENNKLYATEIKNAVLSKLPRNIDITKVTCRVSKLDETESVRVQFDISVDGYEAGDYSFYANLYNPNYTFEALVNSAILQVEDFAK